MIKTFIKDFVMKHPVVTLGGVYICAKTVKKCVYAITGYTGSKDSIFSLNFNVNIPETVAEAINKKVEETEAENTEEIEEETSEKNEPSNDDFSTEIDSLTKMFEEWKKQNKIAPIRTTLEGETMANA